MKNQMRFALTTLGIATVLFCTTIAASAATRSNRNPSRERAASSNTALNNQLFDGVSATADDRLLISSREQRGAIEANRLCRLNNRHSRDNPHDVALTESDERDGVQRRAFATNDRFPRSGPLYNRLRDTRENKHLRAITELSPEPIEENSSLARPKLRNIRVEGAA